MAEIHCPDRKRPADERLADAGQIYDARQQLRVLRAFCTELKSEMRTLSRRDVEMQEALSLLSVATRAPSRSSSPNEDEGSVDALERTDRTPEQDLSDVEAAETAAMHRLQELAEEEWSVEQQVAVKQIELRRAMMA